MEIDYGEKYNEALERAKRLRDSFYQTMNAKRVVEEIFPELAESEDERIRKEMIVFLKSEKAFQTIDLPKSERWIAWLEKQKESLHISEMCKENADSFTDGIIEVRSFQRGMEEGRRLEKQKDPHYTKRNALFDKCVENCDPKTVEEVNKRVDDIMSMPELSAFEQALTNFIGDWQDDEERWPSKFVKKHGKHILDMAREELQKEQKTAEITPNQFDGITYGMKGYSSEKPAECADDVVEEAEEYTSKVACGDYGVEVTEAYIAGVLSERNRGTEWSKEDKDKLYRIIETLLGDMEAARQENPKHYDVLCKAYEELISWLKSLRPSWKPSEEQMSALNYFIKLWGNSDDQLEYTKIFNTVKSLRDDLEKLM